MILQKFYAKLRREFIFFSKKVKFFSNSLFIGVLFELHSATS